MDWISMNMLRLPQTERTAIFNRAPSSNKEKEGRFFLNRFHPESGIRYSQQEKSLSKPGINIVKLLVCKSALA